MRSGLSISEQQHERVHVLLLKGYLDGHTYVELERKLDELLRKGDKRVVIDLHELGYIASAGVGVFINGQHQLKKLGGNLQLVNPSQSVREIFSILGLESLFVIHEDLKGGIAAAALD